MLAVKNILIAISSVLGGLLTAYFWVVLASCILGWVGASPYNPVVRMLRMVTEPVFLRVRKLLPFTYAYGIDFSPIVVVIIIQFLEIALVNTLRGYAEGINSF